MRRPVVSGVRKQKVKNNLGRLQIVSPIVGEKVRVVANAQAVFSKVKFNARLRKIGKICIDLIEKEHPKNLTELRKPFLGLYNKGLIKEVPSKATLSRVLRLLKRKGILI